VVSLNVCHVVGSRGENSTEFPPMSIGALLVVMASHIIHENTITPMMLINLPDLLTTFQVTMESG